MEIATLLIGYLLGMIQIINSIKFVLSCATSYIVMKMAFSTLNIWSFSDYNNWGNYELFWHFEYKWLCVGLVLFFLTLFYWALPKFFIKIISAYIAKKIQTIYSSFSNREIFKAKGFIRKILRKFYSMASIIHTPDEKIDVQTAPSYNKMAKIYAETFSMIIHLMIVLSFILNNYFMYISSFFIIVISSLLILLIIPIFFVAKTHILNMIAEEHNRFVI